LIVLAQLHHSVFNRTANAGGSDSLPQVVLTC